MEALGGLSDMSKAEFLRGIVIEKLTTAAREILAVVERTVAGYEEEASGLRQEIERRRQLEVLLQPPIKLETPDDQFPVCGPAAGGREEEEEQHKYEPSVEDGGGLGLICHTEVQMEEAEEEEDQEHVAEPDYEAAARLSLPKVQSDRRSAGRRCISEPQEHVDLRICILEDSQIKVLSARLFKKYPVQELRCLCGLQEEDFLDLLRSTFPQLANQKPFDIFTSDKTKRLQPLRVKTLTPEEIRSTTGHSTLYIQLKTQEELKSTDEEFHPSQRKDAAVDSPSTSDQTSLLSPRVQSDRRKSSRLRISEPQDHVDLRICILEDSRTDVLSFNVYKKYPVLELWCPCGLQEEDFLDLLRSTFPQLTNQEPFDIFTSDRTRRLQPLRVETLTPEEIRSTMGHSTLYIRLKIQEELKSTDEEFHPSQRKDAADSPSTSDQTSLLSPTVQSDKRKTNRPQINEPQDHIDFRIRILEDSQIEVMTPKVYKKYPIQELRCPCGLQEADFLDLLRSTFPKAAQNPFDVFTADRARRLQPLEVETLTPQEIRNTTGHSALYIRLKPPEEVQAREKEPLQKNDDDAAAKVSPSTDRTGLKTRVQSDRGKPGRHRISEPQNHLDLSIRILEDSRISVITPNVFKKYPAQELQCPRGLQEEDFLDLLRSAFPQLAAHRTFDIFTTDENKRLQPLGVETLTPEEIHRTTGCSTVYIRLKEQEQVQAKEEELQDSSSSSDPTRLNMSSTSQHEDMETEEADNEDSGRSGSFLLVLSENEGGEGEVSNDNWKPDKHETHLSESEAEKTMRKRQVERSGLQMTPSSAKVSTDNGDAPLSCKICGALHRKTNILIKHAWSHVDDPERLCGVCGEHSESAEELRSHLQRHQKTHSCDICGKSFISMCGLNGHVVRHNGKKPYKCNICHKAFAVKSVLKNHKWVHAVNKPQKCDICPKSFVSKSELTRHKVTHTGEKLHCCDMCGKSLCSLRTLSQHMQSHLVRETKFDCKICSKTCPTKHNFKNHMRSHSTERPYVCRKCNKGFLCKSNLETHMRSHTGEKPYKCSVCDMAFSQCFCVERRMKSEHDGLDDCRTEAPVEALSERMTDAVNGGKGVVKRVR